MLRKGCKRKEGGSIYHPIENAFVQTDEFQLSTLIKNNNKCLTATARIKYSNVLFSHAFNQYRTRRNASPFLFWATRTAKRRTAPLWYQAATTTDTLASVEYRQAEEEEETIRAARRSVLNRRRLLSAAVTMIALRVPDRRRR